MVRKRKRKIRWKGVALLVFLAAVILVVFYFSVCGVVRLISGVTNSSDNQPKQVMPRIELQVSPKILRTDSLLAEKVEQLIARSPRLDSTIIAVSLYDLSGQRQVFAHQADQGLIPASCIKIPTALAALHILGPNFRYQTKIDAVGDMRGDTLLGTLHLKASCDPLITSFDSLVSQVRAAGIRVVKGEVVIDLEREDTLSSHPSTMVWDITFPKIPLLLRGRKCVEKEFFYELAQHGIIVQEQSSQDRSDTCRTVASVETPLTDVLTPMLIFSSNVKAEAVFYLLDHCRGLTDERRIHWDAPHASTQFWEQVFACKHNALDAFRQTKHEKFDVLKIVDGSGLSPLNRLSANVVVEMLLYAWNDSITRDYLINEGLASPGHETRRGSLKGRLSDAKYKGRIFVKTGTMTTQGVSSLAGYIHTNNNLWYAFAVINNDCPIAEGRLFQDDFCKLFFNLPKD